MLSNAYFLEKFRFDTAENEPAKNTIFSKNAFSKNVFFENRLERSVKPLMTELSAPEEDAYAGDEVQVAAARVQAAWKPKFGLTLS